MSQHPGGNQTSDNTNNKTSVKVAQRPGGNTTISLGWDNEPSYPQQTHNKAPELKNQDQPQESEHQKKTSVKVHAPPGGKSSFKLG